MQDVNFYPRLKLQIFLLVVQETMIPNYVLLTNQQHPANGNNKIEQAAFVAEIATTNDQKKLSNSIHTSIPTL